MTTSMDKDELRDRRLDALRSAAAFMDGFDIDEFGDDVRFHGATVARWAADEIQRLTCLMEHIATEHGLDGDEIESWDDWQCGHDGHGPEGKRGERRGYDRRMLIMRQSWPSATDTGVIRPDHKGDTP